MIWVLRCDRVIQENDHSPREVKKRWTKKVNKRLTEDKIMATKISHTNDTLSLVKSTWGKALEKQHQNLDPDWIHSDEALS
jgi:uncharacterized membrane-anchored protein YjiN (DUF445 family)